MQTDMRKIISLLCSALLLCGVAKAQYDSGGVVIDPSTITAFDMFNSAHTQFNTITARSAAMAGAMTSLGADASSMSINPAGVGMYRTNEITITPMLSFTRSKTDAQHFEGNGANRFALGNFGMVAKFRESSTGITAINMGLSYNRLADFNYKYSFAAPTYANMSISSLYADQLSSAGITSAQLKQSYDSFGNFIWSHYDPTYWGAILAYKTGLVNDNGSGIWGVDMLPINAVTNSAATVESKGSAGEWVWSLGINFNSKFYLGMSLGVSTISQEKHIYYGEDYTASPMVEQNYRMEYFNYDQITKMKGTGVNFKIGGIYRPIENLRIGVAFHTPTYYSVTYKYQGGMTSKVKALNNVDEYTLDTKGYINPPFSEQTEVLIDDGDYSWRYTTPMRLMAGVSYTVAKQLILSVDYERSWYNTMRMKNSPYGALYKGFIKDEFEGSNTLRAGAEWRFIPQMAIRLGYGLWSGGLDDDDEVYSSPVIYRTEYMSTGLGIALSKHFSVDLAYSYSKNSLTPYMTFYGSYPGDNGGGVLSGQFNTSISRHNAMVTLTVKF